MRRILTTTVAAAIAAIAGGCAESADEADERAAVGAALDGWHRAAAAADEAGYLGRLADDAVFMGTDPDERWDKAAFRAYVRPYFAKGVGWRYVPRDRHVRLAPGGGVAWVDERLANEKYGELRGTAVLRKDAGDWRIVHYSMTFLVPNAISAGVVEAIRAGRPR